jgi:site-specific DNA-methyltransferase (adenine-specific)
MEPVVIYECVPGCPVAALDEQSGVTTSGAMKREVGAYEGESTTGFIRGRSGPSNQHGDKGGASRFFPQFEGQEPVEVPFLYMGKASKKETSLDGEIVNDHPTKKPLKLMQWLVRLVTCKGGLVLDPYCGSGSTLHAAVEEGMRFTGIERDEHAHAIASARMKIVTER